MNYNTYVLQLVISGTVLALVSVDIQSIAISTNTSPNTELEII